MIFFLVGYMGAGKSSVGRKVAAKRELRFEDMDAQIERMSRMSISEIFTKHGQAYFRKCERSVLEDYLGAGEDMVVATGGGVPCFEDNMQLMNNIGVTIYLRLTPGALVDRLEYGREKRPIIKDMNDEQLLAFIEQNLALREPYYTQAHATIDCDAMSDVEVCRLVDNIIERSLGMDKNDKINNLG